MKKSQIVLIILLNLLTLALVQAEPARNPVIWADVPDVAVIRVGDTYYMSSTTMHMNPGLPIMKSKDLVNWELIGYAYDRLVENDAMNLKNGRSCFGRGTWASCLRYHNGTYYVSTFSSTSGRTHIYTTQDIEKGYWTNFAKYGHPNGEGIPKWPAFSDANPVVMYFAQTPHTGAVPSAESLQVLDAYFAWRRTPEGEAWAK